MEIQDDYVNVSSESFPRDTVEHILFKSNNLTDVTLVSDDKKQTKFPAHKTVLSIASPIFKSLLLDCVDQQPTIFLSGVDKEVLNLLMEFIYGGEVDVNKKMFNDFVNVSNTLQLKELAHLKKFVNNDVPQKKNVDLNRVEKVIKKKKQNKSSNGNKKSMLPENTTTEEVQVQGDIKMYRVTLDENTEVPINDEDHDQVMHASSMAVTSSKVEKGNVPGPVQRKRPIIMNPSDIRNYKREHMGLSKDPDTNTEKLKIEEVKKIFYQCPECDLKLKHVSLLQAHIESKHYKLYRDIFILRTVKLPTATVIQ